MGHPGAAADLIGRAVELVPKAAVFRATLAEAYRAMGLHEAVIACCRAAIGLGLHDPGVLNNLGLAFEALARHGDAADAFREALALRPATRHLTPTWAPLSVPLIKKTRHSTTFAARWRSTPILLRH